MGSITPVLTGLTSAIGAADTLVNTARNFGKSSQDGNAGAEQSLALRQLQDKQAVAMRGIEEDAALERARIAADATATEEARRAALRRAVARQRAQFGAQGLDADAGDGSSEAVLLGLFDESDQDRAVRAQQDALRQAAITQDVTQQKRLNVLQKSQLEEKQALDRALAGY